MSSSPSRRRQSVRTPQRRNIDSSKKREEETFDPFVTASWSPTKAVDTSILKQTLLSQLNARTGADSTFEPYSFTSPVKLFDNGTTGSMSLYDDKHKRLFSSMKSIASPRTISHNRFASTRPPSVASRVATPNLVPRSATKRAGPEDSSHVTPNKRRRIEVLSPVGSPVASALSFNFDRPGKGSSNNAIAKITAKEPVKKDMPAHTESGKNEKPADSTHTFGRSQPQTRDAKVAVPTTIGTSSPARYNRSGIPRPGDLRNKEAKSSRLKNSSPRRLWH